MRLRDRGCKRHNKMAKGISARYIYNIQIHIVHLKVYTVVLQILIPLPQRHQGHKFCECNEHMSATLSPFEIAESGEAGCVEMYSI